MALSLRRRFLYTVKRVGPTTPLTSEMTRRPIGVYPAGNMAALSRGLGRDILAVPMRGAKEIEVVTPGSLQAGCRHSSGQGGRGWPGWPPLCALP